MISSRIVPRGFQPHARRWLSSHGKDREPIIDSSDKVGAAVNRILERNNHGKDREPILDSSDKVGAAVNRILERNNSLFKKPGRAFGIFSGSSTDLQELFLKCGGRSVVNDGEEISFVFKKPGRTLGISSDLQELFETFGGRYVVEDGAECYVKQTPPIIGWSRNSSYFKERQANNALDPSVITGDQLRTVLDVQLVPLFQSEWKYNARQVEDELKRRFLHLEFGTRLFRKPAVAAWRAPPDGILHKVGMAFSDKIPELIEKGEIVVKET